MDDQVSRPVSYLLIDRLEDDVRDLLFVMNKKSVACQIRAWRTSFRIKKLTKRAQLLHIGLPVCAVEIQRLNVLIHLAFSSSFK